MDRSNRILEYACSRFLEKGFSSVTMEEVARGCGVGKATLYKHFPSKEALLFACVEHLAGALRERMDAATGDASLSCAEKLHLCLQSLLPILTRVNRASLEDMQRSAPEVYSYMQQTRSRLLLQSMTRLLEEGVREGLFTQDTQPVFVVHALIGALSHLAEPTVLTVLETTPSQAVSRLFSLVMQGCLTDSGRKSVRLPL